MSRLSDYWSVEGDAGGYYVVDGYGNQLNDKNFLTRSAAEEYLRLRQLMIEDCVRRVRGRVS